MAARPWPQRPPELWSLPVSAQEDFRRTISAEEQRWLDAGQGCCVLQEEECRAWLVEALHHFDGDRYTLDDYVIMPNHAHALVLPAEEWALGKIIASWKQYSARRINERMQREGALWQHESFDHIVRAWDKLEQCRRYIAANPVKAKLRAGSYHVGRGAGICQ
jgi:putative transposase